MMTHMAALLGAIVAASVQIGPGLMAGMATALETQAGPGAPAHLRCEYLVDPLGVESPRPRLSWELTDHSRGAAQGAYRILVASSRSNLDADRGDVWDSGKVDSDATSQIEYAG